MELQRASRTKTILDAYRVLQDKNKTPPSASVSMWSSVNRAVKINMASFVVFSFNEMTAFLGSDIPLVLKKAYCSAFWKM